MQFTSSRSTWLNLTTNRLHVCSNVAMTSNSPQIANYIVAFIYGPDFVVFYGANASLTKLSNQMFCLRAVVRYVSSGPSFGSPEFTQLVTILLTRTRPYVEKSLSSNCLCTELRLMLKPMRRRQIIASDGTNASL